MGLEGHSIVCGRLCERREIINVSSKESLFFVSLSCLFLWEYTLGVFY